MSHRSPPAFHVMLKPGGALCNLDCCYCYFLEKETLYPGSSFRMSLGLLEDFTRQYIEAQRVPEVTFAWQGGEPTLMGLDFFQYAVKLQEQYRKPGMQIRNAFQTNGVLLDDNWCAFLKENEFLVGISLDGPNALHDTFRVDKGGEPTFNRVMRGLAFLRKHQIEFNVLTCVHSANAPYPLMVYDFLRCEAEARHIQFIPVVEHDVVTNRDGHYRWSVTGADYGHFLITIFDRWVREDVGRVFVQLFDVALAAWSGLRPGLCVHDQRCGHAVAMEHNGDVYSCDHYVDLPYLLGNIEQKPLSELVSSRAQRDFGLAKQNTLPRMCRDCDVLFVCNGGCPKDRLLTTPDGEPGLNYLCEGYKAFFAHINQPMRYMADALARGRSPATVTLQLARDELMRQNQFEGVKRNDPCPCGSGLKYKKCCGRIRH